MTFNRAYSSMLDYILQFGLSYITQGEDTEFPRTRGSSVGFVNTGFSDNQPKVGDLIVLTSANALQWRLSWLDGITQAPSGDCIYLCRSIKDQSLCDWSNVGVSYLHRMTLNQHPEWKWSDDQWAFNDKWMRAANKECDAYIWRPLWAQFWEDDSVTIGVRQRHGMENSPRPIVTIQSWKKITLKKLIEHYRALEKQAETQWKERLSV